MGVNIWGKYGIPNLLNLSKISHENEILSQRTVCLNPLLNPTLSLIKTSRKSAKCIKTSFQVFTENSVVCLPAGVATSKTSFLGTYKATFSRFLLRFHGR